MFSSLILLATIYVELLASRIFGGWGDPYLAVLSTVWKKPMLAA